MPTTPANDLDGRCEFCCLRWDQCDCDDKMLPIGDEPVSRDEEEDWCPYCGEWERDCVCDDWCGDEEDDG